MSLKKYLDLRLLGLSGAILMIISEFIPWFSGLSLIQIYLISISVSLGEAFIYLFPLVSGIICAIGSILVLYKFEYKFGSVIINFIGLGFFLIFLFNIIPRQIDDLPYAQIGFYISIIAGILILLDVINILLMREN